MASEMPFESIVAFIDGSTPATPANDLMRPRDGAEQAGQGRQVPQHRQVAGPLLDLRQLAQGFFVHRLLNVVLRCHPRGAGRRR